MSINMFNTSSEKTCKHRNPSSYGQRDLDMTKEEFQRISDALKKEEFRKLFLEYIDEIQDPVNRKRYEEEIIQFEAERGVDVTFINPEPGFVIKTSQDGDQKCFINCAKCNVVPKPTSEICMNPETGTRGLNWSIPMAQSPPHDDLDNNKRRCCVYDIVFHPDAIYMAQRNNSFHKCLVDTALDAVEREFQVKLDRVNLKFPKLEFKGLPRSTIIRKLAKNAPPETTEPHPLESIYPAKPAANAGQPKIYPAKNKEPITKSTDYTVPKYQIKYSRNIDLSECTNELDAKLNITIPRHLIVEIELPLLNSSADCQLDVTERTVFLLSDRTGAKYRLNINLPYLINEKEGSARFDIDTRRLSITLPVIQNNNKEQRQIHESLLHICREDSGVESDVREDLPTESNELITEINTSINSLDNIQIDKTNIDKSSLSSIQNLSEFLKQDLNYQMPSKFHCNVLNNTLSWILQVQNVQPESLEFQRFTRQLHLKFVSIGSGYFPIHYSFYIELPDNTDCLEIINADVEAWENNVILNIHLNRQASQVEEYLAGLDKTNLYRYTLQEKLSVHRSRQREKTLESSSDLSTSLDSSDSSESIEKEIKSNDNNISSQISQDHETSAGNNEEITEDSSLLIEQKKLNKKQKRKNKNHRSLSESAYDNIKAYQELPRDSTTTYITKKDQEKAIIDNSNAATNDIFEINLPNMRTNHLINTTASIDVPKVEGCEQQKQLLQQRMQRSFSESRDSVISCSTPTSSISTTPSYKGILKHYSHYATRPSVSDSCSSIDDYSTYSSSIEGVSSALDSLRFSQSFGDIPEENVTNTIGLSESCKKTVRFSEVIKKQVFRMDSSILGQRKKNQKRRNRKLRALHRRLSESDSVDYEDKGIGSATVKLSYLKNKSNNNNNHYENCKTINNNDVKNSADGVNKNILMFDMDMDM